MAVQVEPQKQFGLSEVQRDYIKSKLDEITAALQSSSEVENTLSETRKEAEEQVAAYALSLKTAAIDRDYLKPFFKKPYWLEPVPGKTDSWFMYIPRIVPLQLGMIVAQSESYNKFLVNRYADFLGEIPEAIKKEIGLKKPDFEFFLDGLDIKGSPDSLNKAWVKYRQFLVSKEKDSIRINPDTTYLFIAQVVKDGLLPFRASGIKTDDLVERKLDFELRPYQKEAWNALLEWKRIGVYYPPSTGKTIIGLQVITHLKPPHLIVVPRNLLGEQWEERIQAHTDLVQGKDYVVTTYQTAIKKYSGQHWTSLIVDEHQHIPADNFIKLALIPADYVVGLSATPYREDGRENLIFAFSGKPVGLSWQYFKDLKYIQNPICHVWIVKNPADKFKQLDRLLESTKKTLIFVRLLEIGRKVSNKYDIPFVSGETTKNRLSVIRDALERKHAVVVSQVADEGLSLPELERVIEIDWLYGSRREELQRMTRMLHSQVTEGEHNIIMTAAEFEHDKKRLFAIMDKGFKTEIHREGMEDKSFDPEERTIPPERQVRRSRPTFSRIGTPAKAETPQIEQFTQASSEQVASILALPGIQRKIETMNEGEKKTYQFLLQHDGIPYTSRALADMLGYLSPVSFTSSVSLAKMLEKKWIEKVKTNQGIGYRTNMQARVST